MNLTYLAFFVVNVSLINVATKIYVALKHGIQDALCSYNWLSMAMPVGGKNCMNHLILGITDFCTLNQQYLLGTLRSAFHSY